MGGRKRREVTADLAGALARLRSWRRTRRPGTRIPEPLWERAVELAAVHGLHRTASTLQLDYYSLGKRMAAAAGSPGPSSPAFLELPAGITAGRECVLELEDRRGLRLCVHLKGYDAADVVAVGRSLRNPS